MSSATHFKSIIVRYGSHLVSLKASLLPFPSTFSPLVRAMSVRSKMVYVKACIGTVFKEKRVSIHVLMIL